ncbi:MAG TPA: GIY-YIG nuclease family protein [Bacteroidales bacterium]|nr:GIY-YIG nuclease family protein [Bacteroidales bacterium]
MNFVYILVSERNNKYYIGQTENLEARLKKHNSGRNVSTRYGRPWKLKFWQEFETRKDAIKVEHLLKSMKKRELVIKYVEKNDFRGIAQSG